MQTRNLIVLLLSLFLAKETLLEITADHDTEPDEQNKDFAVKNGGLLPSRRDRLQKNVDLRMKLKKLRRKTKKLKSENAKLQNDNNLGSKEKFPENCQVIKKDGGQTDLYLIKPKQAPEAFMVLCDMDTQGGGWTHLLNRFDGTTNFNLSWTDYKQGFGNLGGEFWLGLEYLYQLSRSEVNELLVELTDWDMKEAYAHYKDFSIGNEAEGYSLKVLSRYSGDAGDSLRFHSGRKFSTFDRDQDLSLGGNCAKTWGGGWWYDACQFCYLTGPYKKKRFTADGLPDYGGINWRGFHQYRYSLKQARMMIRPRNKKTPFVLPYKNAKN